MGRHERRRMARSRSLQHVSKGGRDPVVVVDVVGAEPLPLGASVRVRLEDVTRLDGPARLVAERVVPVTLEGIRVELETGVINQRAHYAVRVHVDVDGDGRVTRGDFVSTRSYPVLTFGNPSSATVVVNRVR